MHAKLFAEWYPVKGALADSYQRQTNCAIKAAFSVQKQMIFYHHLIRFCLKSSDCATQMNLGFFKL